MMIIHFMWGYLYITGFASILIFVACVAAARADQIRARTTSEMNVKTDGPRHDNDSPQNRQVPRVKQVFGW
jgi:hypothetical protein